MKLLSLPFDHHDCASVANIPEETSTFERARELNNLLILLFPSVTLRRPIQFYSISTNRISRP